MTGDRRHASTGAGYDCFHVAIGDVTQLAYVEVLPDETRRSTTAFLVRALRWFRARGIRGERVMTDNGSGYVARLFRKALRLLGIRHIRTRPYAPKTNGKAERSIQTLLWEWVCAIPFSSSDARATDLPRWLTWYNQQRPHGSLGRQTPAQAIAGTT
jgi:transposase InsO family protein